MDLAIAFLNPLMASVRSTPTGHAGLLICWAFGEGDGCGVAVDNAGLGCCFGAWAAALLAFARDSMWRNISSFKMRPSLPVPWTSLRLI